MNRFYKYKPSESFVFWLSDSETEENIKSKDLVEGATYLLTNLYKPFCKGKFTTDVIGKRLEDEEIDKIMLKRKL